MAPQEAPNHRSWRGAARREVGGTLSGRTLSGPVRLALARYQPKSIPRAELSRVVVADFAQFASDRLVWVAREPEVPAALRVVVSGTGYRRNKSFPCTSELEVRLERWLEPGGEKIGWVPV